MLIRKLIPRIAGFLVVPYLIVTLFLLGRAYFFADNSLFSLSLADMVLLLLMTPWLFLFSTLIDFLGLEGNLFANLAVLASVAVNAGILYFLGRGLERAAQVACRLGTTQEFES